MIELFGPWSTAIHTRGDLNLSTFWKRRMAMLPALSQTVTRPGRWVLLIAAALAAGTLGLPTVEWVTGTAEAATGTDDSGAFAQATDKPTTGQKIQKLPVTEEYLPRPSKFEEQILAALDKPTTVEFTDLPLEDCATFLKDFHNINVWLDKTSLTDEAVPLDQPITLHLAGVSLRSVLNLILKPMHLTYVIEDDVMKITSQKQAQKTFFTRTYPVSDLYHGRIKADDKPLAGESVSKAAPAAVRPGDLERAIMKTVDSETWDESKGPASITYIKESGSLVIRQTWGAHTKILELLRELREAKRSASGDKK